MRRIIPLLIMVFSFTHTFSAGKTVGHYYSAFYDDSFSILAEDIKDGKTAVYIGITCNNDLQLAYLRFEEDDIEAVKTALTTVKNNFSYWVDNSKKLNLSYMNLGVKLPETTVCWFADNKKVHFAIEPNLSFIYSLVSEEDDVNVIAIVKEVTSYSDDDAKTNILWVFSNPNEIDYLISVLDIEKIKAQLTLPE